LPVARARFAAEDVSLDHQALYAPELPRAGEGPGDVRLPLRTLGNGQKDIDRPHADEARPKACRVDGCERPLASLGLCSMHRKRWLVGDRGAELARPSKREPKPPCNVAGCGRPFRANGFCNAHNTRWVKGKRGVELAKPIATPQLRVPPQRGRPPTRVDPHLAALVHGPGWKRRGR
jgi:hypothetical protein